MHEFDLSDPDQRNQMAAEYVLGTLERDDKAQFESLLAVSHDAQREVDQWREHLNVFNDSLKPIAPPSQVWKSINKATKPKRSVLFNWQALLGFSFAVMFAIGIMVYQPLTTPEQAYAYLIKDERQEPGWVMNASLAEDEVVITCLKEVEMPDNTVYEAWLMMEGKEPVSLGILPDGVQRTRMVKIKPEWRTEMMESEIVVTMEGPQGAPSGNQMGPVSDRVEWKRLRF